MSLTKQQRRKIEEVITETIRAKLRNYSPETKHMPFHYRLVGRDRMALFSFIQSLNTTFGTSVFEPVAEALATLRFQLVRKQYVIGNMISEHAQSEIERIINELTMSDSDPNKAGEIERIRRVCNKEPMTKIRTVKVDLFVQGADGTVHLFDLKTAKPNISDFSNFKRTLLRWIAIYLAKNPGAEIASYIAIPYNPYHPKPYARWTLRGMLDLEQELKVAEHLWDFLGGDGAYGELLDCFERAGLKLKDELDGFFNKFK